MNIEDIIKKSRMGEVLSHKELVYLLGLPPGSRETYRVMAEAAHLSKRLTDGKAEVHAQFAINFAPCPCDCLFCSFARVNGIFNEATELSAEQAIAYVRQFETDGASAVFMMATANFAFERLIEISNEVRKAIRPETTLFANVGDQSSRNAVRLKDAGFSGVYHVVRLREGEDTALPVEKRIQSIRNFQEAGLDIGTCVEPVGPEHTNEELAEMIELTASFNPCFSGAARRIPIPGTSMSGRGIINEMRLAQIVAVTRLGMPESVIGNCTHEPCTLGAIGGANLFWAEVGANPRDIEEKTEEGRGGTVSSLKSIFKESNWDVWSGPTRYSQHNAGQQLEI